MDTHDIKVVTLEVTGVVGLVVCELASPTSRLFDCIMPPLCNLIYTFSLLVILHLNILCKSIHSHHRLLRQWANDQAPCGRQAFTAQAPSRTPKTLREHIICITHVGKVSKITRPAYTDCTCLCCVI